MNTKHLHIGGLVAAGFDSAGAFMLTVSHSGRGIYSTSTWERLARDESLAYPEGGHAFGIGPLHGVRIPVTEVDYDTGILRFSSLDGSTSCEYESGILYIRAVDQP
jgi:hypothetical protein